MKRPRSRAAIISVLILSVLIFGGVYYVWATASDIFFAPADATKTEPIPITIPPNATTAEIATELEEKGIIRNALAFRVWARISGLDTQLQAGVYNGLAPNMTISEITDLLLNAMPDAAGVTIVEGWRVEQIAAALQAISSGLSEFDNEKFLEYVKNVDTFPNKGDHPLLQQVPKGQSMEGMLFPDTYYIPVNATAEDVVSLLVSHMEQNIKDNDLERIAKEHRYKNVYELIIMASIVERETGSKAFRDNIASVYWNRYFEGEGETVNLMQADPTVQYAQDSANEPEAYWTPLRNSPALIEPDSPWNTYVKKGLPPTPIASPGLASLIAASSPPETAYYYFFASTDGQTYFARTNDEFEQLKIEHPVNTG